MSLKSLSPEEVSRRYRDLYTAAVSDVLDNLGLRRQMLPHEITPVTLDMVVAGPAFTALGVPTDDAGSDDSMTRFRMMESIQPGTVAVWSSSVQTELALWGEIMSSAAREHGCTGAVLDGGIRDTKFILGMRFPVFSRFRSAVGSVGRWDVREWMIPITIGTAVIRPDDFIFGDMDGVVVIPKDLTVEVLLKTEENVASEFNMRAELARGVSVSEVYRRHGKL